MSGNNKHSVVVKSITRRPLLLPQILLRQHVCSTIGLRSFHLHELSTIERWLRWLDRFPGSRARHLARAAKEFAVVGDVQPIRFLSGESDAGNCTRCGW